MLDFREPATKRRKLTKDSRTPLASQSTSTGHVRFGGIIGPLKSHAQPTKLLRIPLLAADDDSDVLIQLKGPWAAGVASMLSSGAELVVSTKGNSLFEPATYGDFCGSLFPAGRRYIEIHFDRGVTLYLGKDRTKHVFSAGASASRPPGHF
jgi:hypothetical protein